MNLIELAENLKDVPDNYLLTEVSNPTGSYPSYLVVSELTRRKRLREGAMKQAPNTSVAEDRVNELEQPAGIAGTPQAMASTAGVDVNGMGDYEGEEPVVMAAGGGLVAFASGDRVFGDPQEDYLMSVPGQNAFGGQRPLTGVDYASMIRGLSGMKQLTPEGLEELRSKGISRWEQEVPMLTKEREERIAKRERDIAGSEESNLNMALMRAGLGMMASRSPYGMQGIAEGGLKGLEAYGAGKKDIAKAKDLLEDSKENFAKAKELYAANKFKAGDNAVDRALAQERNALQIKGQQMAGMKAAQEAEAAQLLRPGQVEKTLSEIDKHFRTVEAEIASANLSPELKKAQIDKLRADAAEARAKASAAWAKGFKLATSAEMKTTIDLVKDGLAGAQISPSDPRYQQMLYEYVQDTLRRQGKYMDERSLPFLKDIQGYKPRSSALPGAGGSLIPNKGGGFTYQPSVK